jgi:hypothetical protein
MLGEERFQFQEVDWLVDHPFATCVESFLIHVVIRGNGDDRHIPTVVDLLYRPRGLGAIHQRHRKIHEDQ